LGVWVLGFGFGGLGLGPNPQTPNPQSPIPNPPIPILLFQKNFYFYLIIKINIYITKMKKSTYNGGNKELEKLRQENKKIKEEFEKYKELTNEKIKDLDFLLSQNEKMKKENEDLKKKLSKININNPSQNIPQKPIDKLKIDLHNKEATISLISKQKHFLLSIITRLTNLNLKNKINKDIILSQLDEKNIDKEKDKEKLVNDIINTVQEGKKNILNINKNNGFINLSKNNFSFEIVINTNNSKIISSKNNKTSNINSNNRNEKNNYKKEAELIRKLNEMLGIIQKKKELLRSKKNSLSFRVGTIKEGK